MAMVLTKTVLVVVVTTFCFMVHAKEILKPTPRPLVIPLAAGKVSLDPRLVLDQSSLWINRQLNCQLVRHEGSEVVNDAAEKIEFKNQTKIEITLRSNLFFSDGTPVRAEDVVETFDFLRRSRRVHRNIFQWVQRIETLSPHRLLIELTKPTPQFLKTLGAPTQPIYSKSFLTRAKMNPEEWSTPVSCGGYRIKERTKDSNGRTVLSLEPVRKELHPIRFVLTGTNSVPVAEIMRYDVIGLPVSGEIATLAQQYRMLEIFDPYQIFFAINTKLLPWTAREKRCRLLQSIDPRSVVESYRGIAESTTDWFPRGVIGYVHAQSETTPETVGTFKHPFCLATLGVSIPEPLRPAYASMFKDIFSDVQSHVIYNTKSFGRMFLESKCDGIVFGLKSGYLDGYEYIQFLVEEEANVTGWRTPQFVKMVKESQDIADPVQRVQSYRQIVDQIDQECIARSLLTIPQRKIYTRTSLDFPNIGRYPLDEYYLGLVK